MFEYLLILGLILVGALTSYEDIKYGKIRNTWIISAFLYGIAVNIFFLKLELIDIHYMVKLLSNAIYSLIFGIILWHAGIWTPGDAKLFTAYVFLSINKLSKNFYFFDLFVVTFAIAGFYVFISTLVKGASPLAGFNLKSVLRKFNIFYTAVFVFSFSWLIKVLMNFFNLNISIIVLSLIFYLFLIISEKTINIRFIMPLLVALSILRIFVDSSVFRWDFIKYYLFILILILTIRFISAISHNLFTDKIPVEKLKPGMVIAEIVYKDKGKYKKRRRTAIGLFSHLSRRRMKNILIYSDPTGLTRKEIGLLKKLRKLPGFDYARISKTTSFAIFLFIATLLNLLLTFYKYGMQF